MTTSTTATRSPVPPPPPVRPDRRDRLRGLVTTRRVVSSLILAVATALLVVGLQASQDGGSTVRQSRPAAVLRVFPTEGAAALRQEPIGVQLTDDYTGEIEIDGQPIPLDQTDRPVPVTGDNSPAPRGLSGLNQVSFRPEAGKVISSLSPGGHVARILYWLKVGETRDQAAVYTWSFTAS